MSTTTQSSTKTLDQQLELFKRKRFIAMPIAGAIMWSLIGIAGVFLNTFYASLVLFGGTGMIFYFGLFLARFTGEDIFGRDQETPFFDRLFLLAVGMSLLVFSIAIPFFLIEPTSLPLSVGILTGLMWLPLSGMIQHWVGIFHTLTRTVLILLTWYSFPQDRFVAIPLVIVAVYLISIYALEIRWRTK